MRIMESQNCILIALSFIGFFSLCKPIIALYNWLWIIFFRSPKNLKEYGSWAIITGSTDGIGKAIAFQMASKGLNLVLVGRNPSKLEATSNEIREKYSTKVNTKTIVMDLAICSGEEIVKGIEEGIKGLDIGILINNAGIAYPYARYLHEVDFELMESMMRVNVDAATWITKAVLPTMIEKKKGAIVNIGSGSSCALPTYPLYALYGASKAYLAMFSKSISSEYRQYGIDVQCQIPFFVATKMTEVESVPFLIPSAETYSKASVARIGYEDFCVPYWSHSVQWFIISALPDAVLEWCTFQLFLRIRKTGQQKEFMAAKVK